MPTVFERTQIFEQTNKKFKFSGQGRSNVGIDIKRKWDLNIDNWGKEIPTSVSNEPGIGTFRVLNYPDWFTSTMDDLIVDYVSRIYYKKDRINEKPTAKKLSKTIGSVPPPDEKKKRKRIPIPAYTTRKK